MTKLKIAGILALMAVVTYVSWGCVTRQSTAESRAAALPEAQAQVTRGDIEETISATGVVAAEAQVNLVFKTGGTIEEIFVDEGSEIAEGQALARLDDGQLRDQIARTEASLATALARLAQTSLPASDAETAAAEASVTSARANLDRLLAGPAEQDLRSAQFAVDAAKNQLWAAQSQRDSTAGNPMSSQGAVDAAEAQVLSAEISVQQALLAQERLFEPPRAEDIAIAQSQLDQAKAQLAQILERPRAEDIAVLRAQADETLLALTQAQASLEDAVLRAPFDGTVLQVLVNEGEMTSSAAPSLIVAKDGQPKLSVNVDELDVAAIHEGQSAWLTFEALPRERAAGTVTYIAPGATNVGGAVAYVVEISFDSGELPVRLGMTTDVEIVIASAQDALLAPNRAIESDRTAGRYYVSRLLASGETERVQVAIGLSDAHHTQILSGLDEGDTLLLPQIDGAADFENMMPGMGMMQSMREGVR